MTDLQTAKGTARAFHAALDAAGPDSVADVLGAHTADRFLWRGVHPFGVLRGPSAVAATFWSPLKTSMTRLQRRDDVFFAGANEIDGGASVWVVAMGHLVGLFDQSWLGIRPTGKMAFLRYCTFHRIDGDRIGETVMHLDIPHLMVQAGQNPFPPQTGAHSVQPGPRTHDGLLFEPEPEATGAQTLTLINAMTRDIGQWTSSVPLDEELRRTWHDDMIWWGPAGIGASYTIKRYAEQHAGPFRAGLANRSKTEHIARLAEGNYGGFFGWPNFTAEPVGGLMGMPATGKLGEFRVIDIYRRAGDKLAENWVFIDLLHFWTQQGVDHLGRHYELVTSGGREIGDAAQPCKDEW